MMRIVLASKSPRRKKLLQQIGLAFEISPSDVEEISSHTEPGPMVEGLAALKAADVASKFTNSFIIGSDTIVVHNQQVLNKPENEDEAFAFLSRLSGTHHFVYTGVAFVKTDKNGAIQATHSFYEQTKVTFSALGEQEIKAYIKSGNPMDKAGAYGIQDDLGALFVEKIDGDYYNVVGFPLNRFYREMKFFFPKFDIMSS
jgi:septum formation protein